ncbi:MAG TPA: hypothetical protein V6D47_09365 [Oscillatoriaceae cyanobacterium]
MRQNVVALLALVSLAACQLPNAGTPRRDTTTSSTKGATKTTAAAASPTDKPASNAASATTPPTETSPSLGPTTLITGLIQLDPAYVIAAKGGSVIAAGGGNVIAAGGGNVIAAGGGNVIAAGGGNVIAAGGGNYRVLDASGTAAASASGTQELPVKGMLVAAVSLKTHDLLAKAVYTDDTGHYQLAIPQDEKDNYVILAGIPGESADDPLLKNPELHFTLLAHQDASGQVPVLDEDTSWLSYYMRTCVRPYMPEILFGNSHEGIDKMLEDLWLPTCYSTATGTATTTADPIAQLICGTFAQGLTKLKGHLPSPMPSDIGQQQGEINALVDVALATALTPDKVPISPYVQSDAEQFQGQSAADLLKGALKFMREAADRPNSPLQTPQMQAIFATDPDTGEPLVDPETGKAWSVKNGADLERFVVEAYLTGGISKPVDKVHDLLLQLCGTDYPNNEVTQQWYAIHDATLSFLLYVYQQASTEDGLPPLPTGLVNFD